MALFEVVRSPKFRQLLACSRTVTFFAFLEGMSYRLRQAPSARTAKTLSKSPTAAWRACSSQPRTVQLRTIPEIPRSSPRYPRCGDSIGSL